MQAARNIVTTMLRAMVSIADRHQPNIHAVTNGAKIERDRERESIRALAF
jgi:hypothetical protein